MGQIVSAMATSHVLFHSEGVEASAASIVAAFHELGERLRGSSPDVLFVASSDHGRAMPHSGPQAAFAVGITDTFTTAGDMGVPQATFRSRPDIAEQFTRFAADRGFDLAALETFMPDHGVAIPSLMLTPQRDVPIVPLFLNANHPTVWPSTRRAYGLGSTLAEFVQESDVRAAVVGTGGLSHWPGMPEMGRVNQEFDRRFLDLLVEGRAEEATAWTFAQILEEAGNGGLEINNWLFAAGTAGDKGGDVILYEPLPEWFTGMASFVFANGA